MFNDDIQGTAATTLAGKFWALQHMFSRKKTKFRIMKNISIFSGIYGALKVQGLSPSNLVDLKFVVCGAGSAAAGVMLTIRNGKYEIMKFDLSLGNFCYQTIFSS